LYVGDFNCQHVNWGYNKTSPGGDSLDSWATSNNLGLLYNPKETASFSRRWDVGTNPDLAFASFGQDSRLPDRLVLGKLPRSQHRPSLITPPRLKLPAHSDPVKCCNFRKAGWKRFCLLTGESIERLPHPDTLNIERAYQDFCESLPSAAKQCIPRRRRKNYVPCWDIKSARPFIAPSSEHEWGLTLTELHHPYYLGYNRSRSSGRKLSTPSASRSLARGVENNQQTYRQVWTLPSPVPCLGKYHRLATCEEWDTQDRRPRVHQARQQAAVRPMEDSNT